METELLDWELVEGSDSESTTDSIASESLSVIDDGMILSDHFSPDNHNLDESHAEIDAVADDDDDDYDSRIEEDATECTDHLQAADDAPEPIEDPTNSEIESSDSEAVVEESGVVRCGGDETKSRETVWWKMPLVLVKYSSFRIGPVWSLSMAAALMGFLLLGRRLYLFKKKPQLIHLKVANDYNKVSQVMSQAARLNEAFAEVRRVPVIPPALPAPGAWPVLSLR